MMKKYIFISLFILFIILFIKKGVYEFNKIENEKLIDWISDNEITVTYTTKDDIKNLYKNNKDFFQDLVFELNKIEDIHKYNEIQIPFNYPQNDLLYYGNSKDNIYLYPNSVLKDELIFLSNELKINRIYIRLTNGFIEENSNDELLNCDYIFAQDDGSDDSYIGIAASSANYGDNTGHILKNIFKNYNGTSAFLSKIGKVDNVFWYYRCSRSMSIKKYNFWQRVYDTMHCNI